jgi:alpha-N-arabinofuranosidase
MAHTVNLAVDPTQPGPQISRHLFGQFAEHLGRCVYEGIWVGEDSPIPNVRGIRQDVVAALRAIKVPNLRWPGGCFADAYHWRDGIGPRDRRPKQHNDVWNIPESNAFGTHEFLDLCGQLGCEPVICGNLGSGTVQEMRDWIEYLNAPLGRPLSDLRAANGHPEPFRVRYWGVGNESYGCGGNLEADFYANEFRRYSTYLPSYEKTALFRIACGHDLAWNETMLRLCAAPRCFPEVMSGLTLHYYMNGGLPPEFFATKFDRAGWNLVMGHGWHMDTKIREHAAQMDKHDPKRRIALIIDEWGSWYTAEPGSRPNELYQQQTVRDAVLAGLTLNAFIAHAERVRMANIAQVVNVLQAMILTFGREMVRTPTWHVFKLYTPHHDAARLPVASDAPERTHGEYPYPSLSAVASLGADRSISVSLTNTDPDHATAVNLSFAGGAALRAPVAELLTSPELTACNTPDAPNRVAARPWSDFRWDGTTLRADLPPASVATLTFPRS